MSGYRIRHVEPGDASALRALMAEQSVVRNMLQLPHPSLAHCQTVLQRPLAAGSHALACVAASGELLGQVGLWGQEGARKNHAAYLGISVRGAWQGKGVGTALMAAVTDLADNWLGLKRIELWVYPDNAAAIALYRKFGFETEARLRAHSLRDGAYHDAQVMARLREGRL